MNKEELECVNKILTRTESTLLNNYIDKLRKQLKQTEELAMEYKINAHDNKEMCLTYKNLYEEEKTKNKKAIEILESINFCIMPDDTLIHGADKVNAIKKAYNILQGKDNE